MENFNIDDAINSLKGLMVLIGTWPERSPTFTYRFTGFLTMSTLCIFTVATFGKVFTDIGDLKSVSFGICCSMASSHSVVKHYMVFFNKPLFYKMLDSLKEPILACHENNLGIFLEEKIRVSKLCRSTFFIASLNTAFMILLSPVLDTKTKRSLPVPFPVDMKDQKWFVYYSIYGLQSVWIMLICTSISCLNGIIFTFIAIAAGQLKIVREKILRAPNCCPPPTSLQLREKNDAKINDILKQCVQHHIAIERFIKLIEDNFAIGFLVQLLVSLVVICLIGFNSLLVPVTSLDFLRCLFFFVAAIVELAFFCIPANEIILESQKIRDACYMSEWTDCSVSVRKTLFIIMEKSKRPLSLSAAQFVSLSLDTLVKVLKTSFSYFTVLKRVYTDSRKP